MKCNKDLQGADRERKEPLSTSILGEQSGSWYCSRRVLAIHLSSVVSSTHSEPRKGRTKSNDPSLGVRSTSAFAPSNGDPARGVTIPLSFSGNPVKLELRVGLRVGVVCPDSVPLSSSSSSWTHGWLDVTECRRVCAERPDADAWWIFESEAD